jgi:hypothetical protein
MSKNLLLSLLSLLVVMLMMTMRERGVDDVEEAVNDKSKYRSFSILFSWRC